MRSKSLSTSLWALGAALCNGESILKQQHNQSSTIDVGDQTPHLEVEYVADELVDTQEAEKSLRRRRTVQDKHTGRRRAAEVVEDLKVTPRIINGSPAEPREYPYFATRWSSNYICGAALVAPDILVTAAHCEPAFIPNALVGAYKLDSKDYGATVVKVTERIPHPEYVLSRSGLENDLMVLKIDPPVKRKLARLNFNPLQPFDGQNVMSIGMGHVNDAGRLPDKLMEIRVKKEPDDVCDGHWGEGISKDYMCAWNPAPLQTVCGGDSGGPLIQRSNNQNLLVGVVSFGEEFCEEGSKPTAYTRISAYEEWLTTTICSVSDNAPLYLECKESEESPELIPNDHDSSGQESTNNNTCARSGETCSGTVGCCNDQFVCTGRPMGGSQCQNCARLGQTCSKSSDCCGQGQRLTCQAGLCTKQCARKNKVCQAAADCCHPKAKCETPRKRRRSGRSAKRCTI